MTISNEQATEDVSRETTEAETTKTETKEKSMDALLNMSYAEMTEEEISRVIEYKAERKAKTDLIESQLKEIQETTEKLYNETHEQYVQSKDAQDKFYELSLQRLKESFNVEQETK